ncbi:hypothetical protein ACWS7L_08050 [Exiguobacterium artemiae]
MAIQKQNSFLAFCRAESGITKFYTDQVPATFTERCLFLSAPLSEALPHANGISRRIVMATVTFFAPKRSIALVDAEKVLLALERRGNKVPLYTQNNTIAGQFLLMDAKIRAIENPVDTVGAVTLTVAWHEEVEHIITRGPLVNRVATYLN